MTKKTFTIIELIIVLVIVGALTALSVTYYLDSQQLSKMHTFEANIENIVKTLDIYRSNKVMSGAHSIVYPTSISDTDFKALFAQEPINPYTGKSMLSSASADSGIQYQSDGTSYSICIAQQDVDDINNNGRIDDPLPVTSYPACTSTIQPPPSSEYVVTVVTFPSDGGTAYAVPNQAASGATITLVQNPASCYNFGSWTSSDVTISNNSFVMPAKNVTITANYTIRQYTVSVAPNNPSYGTVTGSGTYNCGSIATLTAVPKPGYTFVGWYENSSQVSTTATYTFTVSGNRTLEARFNAIPYTITVNKNPAAGGSPTATPNPAYVGQTVTLTSNPDSCYNFSSWSSPDVTITSNSFVMPAKNVSVTANYTVRQYTVSAAPNNTSYGTVTGSGTYNCGSTATLTAVPNTGYTFVGWYESGSQVSTTATYVFTVSGNRTLEARFKSSYVSVFNDTFDSAASLSNWVAKSNSGPLPTLNFDNGALRIDSSYAYGYPYAQSAIAITTPNSKLFAIEGDVKTGYREIWLGLRNSNGQWFRFGFTFSSFCIQGNNMNSCTPLGQFRSYGDWMHLKVVVNNNVITGYVGTTPVLTVNTNSAFMPGYVTAELWDASGGITGWFDNITVYGY